MRLINLLSLSSLVVLCLGTATTAEKWRDSGDDCVGATADEASNNLNLDAASQSHRMLKKKKANTHEDDESVEEDDDDASTAVVGRKKKREKGDKSAALSRSAKSSKSSKSSKESTSSNVKATEFSQVADYMVKLLGMKKMKPKEKDWFEKQTASYVESYYNENHNKKYTGKLTDVDVVIQVTETYDEVLAKKSWLGIFHRRVEETQLTVLFEASMSYKITDPKNFDNEDLMMVPFQTKKSKKVFMNEFLKTNGNFAKLGDLSEMLIAPDNRGEGEEKTPTIPPSPVPTDFPTTYTPTDFPTWYPTTAFPTWNPTTAFPTLPPGITASPTEERSFPTYTPTESTIFPTYETEPPTIDRSDEPVERIEVISYLILETEDNFTDVNDDDVIDLADVTNLFLSDNIGGPNRFTLMSLEIIDYDIKEDISTFVLNSTFEVKEGFWEGNEDRRELRKGNDSACCKYDSLNQNADIDACKNIGLKKDKDCKNKRIECCMNGCIDSNADSNSCVAAGYKRDKHCPVRKTEKNRERQLNGDQAFSLYGVPYTEAVTNNTAFQPRIATISPSFKVTSKSNSAPSVSECFSELRVNCCIADHINHNSKGCVALEKKCKHVFDSDIKSLCRKKSKVEK